MNRLATINPDHGNRAGLWNVLEHLEDAHPDEYELACAHLTDPAVSATTLADTLTLIAREDNLNTKVTEGSIRRYRKAIQ